MRWPHRSGVSPGAQRAACEWQRHKPSGAWGLLALAVLCALLAPAVGLARDVQQEILEQTSRVRQLEAKEPVPFSFVDASTLRQELLQIYTSEQAVRELEISRKLLVVLGLLDPQEDLRRMLIELYSENVLGYYNRVDKRMVVLSGRSLFGPEEKVTLAHEFTHALQDQHFDLSRLVASAENNGDRLLALDALIEGDATLTGLLFMRQFLTPEEAARLQQASSDTSLERAPLIVRDEVLFPYIEGTVFVIQLLRRGGFEAVNDAFRDPPRSSEQILHFEKYLTREQPTEVTLPDLAAVLGPGWSLLRSDVLGELDMRILLEQFGDSATAARGAEGWAGDRFALLENDAGQHALMINSVWDNEAEAGEFFNVYAATVSRRYGQRAVRTEEIPSRSVWATPDGSVLLQKWIDRVALVLGPDVQSVSSLLAAIAPLPPVQPVPPTRPGPVPAPVQVPR